MKPVQIYLFSLLINALGELYTDGYKLVVNVMLFWLIPIIYSCEVMQLYILIILYTDILSVHVFL